MNCEVMEIYMIKQWLTNSEEMGKQNKENSNSQWKHNFPQDWLGRTFQLALQGTALLISFPFRWKRTKSNIKS